MNEFENPSPATPEEEKAYVNPESEQEMPGEGSACPATEAGSEALAGNTAAGVAASARLSRRASMVLAVKPPKAAARPSVSSVGNGRMGPVVPVQGAVAPGAVC